MSEFDKHGERISRARPGDEILPTRWRKKPVVIEAIRWSGTNLKEVIDFTSLHPSADRWTWEEYEAVVREKGLKIFSLEGSNFIVTVGDYIIKGVKGEFYACKPDIFLMTYEPASALSHEAAPTGRRFTGAGHLEETGYVPSSTRRIPDGYRIVAETFVTNAINLCPYDMRAALEADLGRSTLPSAIEPSTTLPIWKWIPVGERMPQRAGDYLVASSTGYVTVLHWDKPRSQWSDEGHSKPDDYWNRFVTHWTAMPSAPTDGGGA